MPVSQSQKIPTLPAAFATKLVQWQQQHGRHDLPWQQDRTPYKVWLSEIMLQQTQVATVKPYYARFLATFPTVQRLAAADVDTVLGLWSGLGYYSRARNLHKAAQMVVSQFGGQFPSSAQQLQQLPGVGASTAAAIAAFCFAERVSILDANVQRVLTRVLRFKAPVDKTANKRILQSYADRLLPPKSCSKAELISYTQGLMDLGANVCKSRKPHCTTCPMQSMCMAYAHDEQSVLPIKSKKIKKTTEVWSFALRMRESKNNRRECYVVKRPSNGVWGGLWCLPTVAAEQVKGRTPKSQLSHELTHKSLSLMVYAVEQTLADPLDAADGKWICASTLPDVGMPTPIKKLLSQLLS